MREILFRGKTYSGVWKEGLPSYDCCGKIAEIQVFEENGDEFYLVIPETIGQYTGLTDKNGVKIFERDILSVGYVDSDEVRNCTVRFGEFTDVNADGDITLGFFLEFSDFKCSILNGKDSGYSLSDVCEVIGSIHDNPVKGDAE